MEKCYASLAHPTEGLRANGYSVHPPLTGSGGPSRAIEGGIVDRDSELEQPIQAIKQEKEAAQAARDVGSFSPHQRAITPARLQAFSKLICEKLETADVQAR